MGKSGRETTIKVETMKRPLPDSPSGPSDAVPTIDWRDALQAHWGWLRTVVRSRVGDTDVADDVMQEIAVAVLEQPSRPTDTGKIAPWLYRVALRLTVNYWRSNGRHRRLLSGFASEKGTGADSKPSPRDWVLRAELRESIAEALRALAPIDREILLLKYTEGWSYKDLAAHLGVTQKTIEHRLAKARRALRSQLREFRAGEPSS
jgi:RNA polymerase sigma-70 factor (ECF subfamily)